MKRLIFSITLLIASASRLVAADAMGVIIYTEPVSKQEDVLKVWMTAASTTQLEYKTTPQSLNRTRIKRSSVNSVYFFEPPIFKEAMDLSGWIDAKELNLHYEKVRLVQVSTHESVAQHLAERKFLFGGRLLYPE